jgi:hypothetical protein
MLTGAQVDATRDEMRANLVLSGLSVDELAARLELSPGRVQTAIDVAGRLRDVWLVRDFLIETIEAAGASPVPFTALVESKRDAVEPWLTLRRAPSC